MILDEDVYKPYPCLCDSNDVNSLRAIRCFNDPSIECESCSVSVCGSWSQWSSWSVCSKSCGGGKRSRERVFTWYDDRQFVEEETESCNTGKIHIQNIYLVQMYRSHLNPSIHSIIFWVSMKSWIYI